MGWPTMQDAGSGDEGSQVNDHSFHEKLPIVYDFFSSRNLMIQDKTKLEMDQIFNQVNSDFVENS